MPENIIKNCGFKTLLTEHPNAILEAIGVISSISSNNNDILQARFHGFFGRDDRLLFLILARGSWVNPNDVLSFSKSVMPRVQQIHVFLGNKQHSFFIGRIHIEPEQWSFFRVKKLAEK